MKLFYTARFLRTFAKLESAVQEDIESAIEAFKKKENHNRLKLHKLHGKMKQYHAFSANYNYRVIVKFEKSNTYFMDVGGHDVYE